MSTSVSSREARTPSAELLKKRAYGAGKPEHTRLLHVNLPASLVNAVRSLANEERRTITSQVALLLEESPELVEYQREMSTHTNGTS